MKNIDESLFLVFNQSGSETWDFFWTLLTDKYLAALLFGVILLFLWKRYNFKTVFVLGAFLVVMVGVTDVFSTVVKNLVERPRPCSVNSSIVDQVRVVSDGVFGSLTTKNAEKCEKFSFFSAHAAVSLALALFFGLILNKQFKHSMFILVVWGVLVSASRIYLGFHYPSDVIVGAIVGALFGFLFFKILFALQSRLKITL
jgi:undecaprenyl-diphosphatase